ncbi:ShlB/FhaC/HecB family hemolysin secretion/activation protein [Pseudomonas rubra]|uniref:ShlB/FhaC/HecB family hemolysin secretion/activation protein n=1 Tax=Pseudomonas rubra TaxID=2942627 RepID=A0ABT5P487_9PSED|nr:POTRA domain-containing protein [Pseudomonas rubra]MDD1012918.1 ShlB/FhaC/HecB family hemolysin secretion/activation protein [Pseudomonas rubra]MDD1038214.1 ShlB/FhaC/HecB family hemolysin secretion/activation protein [Pseudomonas rubra]MDD1156707.1 ShlB/FhaC/HecB family hemolysin secretion/activation protein [Pseudomonas rubra]
MRVLAVAIVGLSWASLTTGEPLPRFLDSHEIERNLPAANLPADAYRPSNPQVLVPVPLSQAQPLRRDTRILLRKVRFEGGSIYPLSDLRDNYQSLVNRDVSLGELIDATQRLTQRYQQDGYLLSHAYLPEQDFADGRVRVVLVEGYIDDLELHGEIGPAAAYVEQLVSRLKAERPLTRATFERYVALMSRLPGFSLQARLSPAQAGHGTSRLIVEATRRPLNGTLTATDGTRDDPQALLTLSSNAQTAFAEQFSVTALAPRGEDHESYFRLDYSQYLDDQGSQLHLSASRYDSDPSAQVLLADRTQLKAHRENDRFSAGLSQVLLAAPGESLNVSARFYMVNDDVEYRAVEGPLRLSNRTDVRALGFEGEWRKADAEQLRIVSGGAYQGLDYLGAKTNSDFDLDFLRLRLSGLQSDRLFGNWQGVASAALYWSGDSLPDSERVVFGGQSFARGYPADQALGDKGWGLAYELNYSFNGAGRWVRLLQPYAVLDTARTWFNEVDLRDSHLSSAALGVRVGDGRFYNIALELAKPLSDVALDSFDREPRVSLSFSVQL